jgi:mannose-1-phosphate guanylyltransferase
MVVTGVVHRGAVLAQLPELEDTNLVLESEPKDSAAAIGLAAAILYRRDPDIIMGSFAADQVITPVDVFQGAVREAIHTAAQGYIVTIGIEPTHPSTGFGYIRAGEALLIEGAPSAHSVIEFVEKPSEPVARGYLESGKYSWNCRHVRGAGRADAQAPRGERARAVRRAERDRRRPGTPPAGRDGTAGLADLPKIAIDYAWPSPPRPPATSP